jgi:SAM-dependent methyltransferase
VLSRVAPDAKVLEIGPGMGRSLVFFAKKFGWTDPQLFAFEGDGKTTKYTSLGPRFEDSFCGNIAMLREILAFNGLREVTVFDAAQISLDSIPGKFNLIYSFFCIGFHWAIEHFLDDILRLLADGGVAIFTTTTAFVPPPALKKLRYEIIDWQGVYPKDTRHKFIVLWS